MKKPVEETCPFCGGWVWHRSEPCDCRKGKAAAATSRNRFKTVQGIGQRVRHCRHGLRLSLDELARRSGRSKTMLWQVETGKSEPGAETLARLAAALGVSIDWLVMGE